MKMNEVEARPVRSRLKISTGRCPTLSAMNPKQRKDDFQDEMQEFFCAPMHLLLLSAPKLPDMGDIMNVIAGVMP